MVERQVNKAKLSRWNKIFVNQTLSSSVVCLSVFVKNGCHYIQTEIIIFDTLESL